MILKPELIYLYRSTVEAIDISLKLGNTSDISGLVSVAKDLIYEIESLPDEIPEQEEKTNFHANDDGSFKVRKFPDLGENPVLTPELMDMFKELFSGK